MKEGIEMTGKGPGVRKMFDNIAGSYDLMNRVMTLGQDQRWRQFVVARAGENKEGWLLDLATGTGDIAALLAGKNSGAKVIGADFSAGMLAEAARRFSGSGIAWQACDANQLPFADNVFQAVTFGYLLRNVDNTSTVLQEVFRVLAPGGMVVCLDTTPPAKNILYPFIQLYFRYGVPLLGRMLAKDAGAYAYLTDSTLAFHSAESLAGFFRQAGFIDVSYRKFMCGTIGVHWGKKEL